MASANLCAASPQLVASLTTIVILNSAPAKRRVGRMPSVTIRKNVGMLIRTLKDFLNAATMSRKQSKASRSPTSYNRSVKSCWFLRNPARHDLRALRCLRQHPFCCIALGLLLAQSGHIGRGNECLLLGVKRTSPKRCRMSAFDPKRT